MPDQTFSEELYDDTALKEAVDRMANLIKTHATKSYVDSAAEQKQDKLTFDSTPAASSTNPVTSAGIKMALDSVDAEIGELKENLNGFEKSVTPTVTSSNINLSKNATRYLVANSHRTQYIAVNKGKTYKITITANRSGEFRFGFCTSVPADLVNATYIGDFTTATSDTFIYTPPGDGYVSVSYYENLLNTISAVSAIDGLIDIVESHTEAIAEIEQTISDLSSTDKTLSIEDKPADAKAVGDELKNLTAATDSLMDKIRPTRILALSDFTQGSIYNGVLSQRNQKCISTIDYIALHDDVLSAKIAQANVDGTMWNVRFSFYTKDGVYVGQNGYSEWNGDFTSIIPSTAELMKVSLSLLDDEENPNITPADYTSNRLVTITLSYVQLYVTQDEIGAIPQGLTKYGYSGEELSYIEHEIAFADFMQLSGIASINGSAAYGDYLFTANNSMSKIAVTDMRSKTQVDTIEFTAVSTYHCNVVNFGTEKYDNADDFPLMYISMENASEHKALVMRIQHTGNTFSATLVQTITYPTNEDAGMYYQNCFIDNDGGYLYVTGSSLNDYHSGNGNKLKIKKYNLPLLSAGDMQLTNADVLGSFEVDLLTAPQGGFIANGKLIQCCGLGSSSYPDVRICMIDLVGGKMTTNILLNNYGITTEQESAFVWDDGLYIMTNGGKITRVYT